MSGLRFTTLVDAPLTVAFDVARTLGSPWPGPLEEVVSIRPVRDVYSGAPGRGLRWVTHSRRFSATGDGTVVEEQVDWATSVPGVPGRLADRAIRRRVRRAMRARLDAYAVAAEERARDVVQVVGAALVDGDRVLVAKRAGGPYAGCWEFPGGKVEPGEDDLAALVREIGEELGVLVVPQGFVGEVVLDGVVAGGLPGASTLRVWEARMAGDARITAHEHAELRWLTAGELEGLDWIPADRPLLPAVRSLLGGP